MFALCLGIAAVILTISIPVLKKLGLIVLEFVKEDDRYDYFYVSVKRKKRKK